MARRLSTFLMKGTPVIISVVALMIGMITRFSLNAQDKESAEARNARYDQLKDQISDYYAVDSPWTRASDFELEGTLFHLIGAEVRVWQLTDNLRDRPQRGGGFIRRDAASRGDSRDCHESTFSLARSPQSPATEAPYYAFGNISLQLDGRRLRGSLAQPPKAPEHPKT